MNEQQTIFNDAVKNKGGIFLHDFELFNVLKTDAESHIASIFRGQKGPTTIVDYVNNRSFNALATKVNNYHIIGINAGLVFLLKNMFEKIFARAEVFSTIGDVKVESTEKNVIDFEFNEGISLSDNYTKIIPRDPLREAAALMCLKYAYSYTVFHELGHIAHGHTNWLLGRKGATWFEFEATSIDDLDFRERQCAENYADQFAIKSSFGLGEALVRNRPNRQDLQHNYFLESLERWLEFWSFAVLCFHLLTYLIESSILDPKLRSHPPPSVRLKFLVSGITQYIKRYLVQKGKDSLGISTEIIETSVMRAANEAEKAIELVTYQESLQNKILTFDRTASDHAAWISERNPHILEKMAQFSQWRT